MIGNIELSGQNGLNFHRNVQLMRRGIFDVDYLVCDLVARVNLVVQSIEPISQLLVKNHSSRFLYILLLLLYTVCTLASCSTSATLSSVYSAVIIEIAQKYENVQKGVGDMMRGAMMETSARKILSQGISLSLTGKMPPYR